MKVYMNSTDRIVIVGGGTAGWFSAVTLNKYFPYKDIVCIESKDVPRVGVGESTLEHFTYWVMPWIFLSPTFTNTPMDLLS